MSRFFALVAVCIVGFGLAAAVAVPAGAQQAGNTTTDGAANATNATEPDVERHEIEKQVDEEVTLESWTYNESTERFTINLDVDRPTTVTIGEAVSLEESGSTQGNVFHERLYPGRHEIELAARTGPQGHAGASITTPRSLDEGRYVIISTGQVRDALPFERTSSTAGWLGGATTSFVMIWIAGVQTIRQMKRRPQEVK